MKIPNDLPADGVRYYADYIAAGGSELKARLYAETCADRDTYKSRVNDVTGSTEEAEGSTVQLGWMSLRMYENLAKRAAELLAELPDKAPAPASGDGFFE